MRLLPSVDARLRLPAFAAGIVQRNTDNACGVGGTGVISPPPAVSRMAGLLATETNMNLLVCAATSWGASLTQSHWYNLDVVLTYDFPRA